MTTACTHIKTERHSKTHRLEQILGAFGRNKISRAQFDRYCAQYSITEQDIDDWCAAYHAYQGPDDLEREHARELEQQQWQEREQRWNEYLDRKRRSAADDREHPPRARP